MVAAQHQHCCYLHAWMCFWEKAKKRLTFFKNNIRYAQQRFLLLLMLFLSIALYHHSPFALTSCFTYLLQSKCLFCTKSSRNTSKNVLPSACTPHRRLKQRTRWGVRVACTHKQCQNAAGKSVFAARCDDS